MLGVLAYLGPFVVIPLLFRRKNRFLTYHARQGMYLFGVFVAALLLTMGLLFVFRDPIPSPPVFLFLSVVLLLEFVTYGMTTLVLAFRAGRGGMPMLPLLGDYAGES